MRINKFIARHTQLSRRKADEAIENQQVTIDGELAQSGNDVKPTSVICLDGVEITHESLDKRVVLIDKPVGYVCSRNGQGSPTVYELIGENDRNLNIAGRLDKDSSGLVILTNDGELLNELTHPSYDKEKVYEVTLDRDISKDDQEMLVSKGVDIGDARTSKFESIEKIGKNTYKVVLKEGRNRQIRRTFRELKKKVISLRRTTVGAYSL